MGLPLFGGKYDGLDDDDDDYHDYHDYVSYKDLLELYGDAGLDIWWSWG